MVTPGIVGIPHLCSEDPPPQPQDLGSPDRPSMESPFASKTDRLCILFHQIFPTNTHDPEPTDGVKMVLPASVTHMASRTLLSPFGTGKSAYTPCALAFAADLTADLLPVLTSRNGSMACPTHRETMANVSRRPTSTWTTLPYVFWAPKSCLNSSNSSLTDS